jgi:hypothetical protein
MILNRQGLHAATVGCRKRDQQRQSTFKTASNTATASASSMFYRSTDVSVAVSQVRKATEANLRSSSLLHFPLPSCLLPLLLTLSLGNHTAGGHLVAASASASTASASYAVSEHALTF